jgi:hypothetical protein
MPVERRDPEFICWELVSILCTLADVAAPYGVRLALEPVSFSPFTRCPTRSLMSRRHREWEPQTLAAELLRRSQTLLTS